MYRAIIFSADPCRDEWVLNSLSRRIRLDYCLCIGDKQVPNDKINYLDFNKIVVGEYEHYINWHEIPPLDETLITQMFACESLLFRLMDDQSAFDPVYGFTISRVAYLKHLRYWHWFLEEYKINLVIEFSVPHLTFDNVIYELCKLRNIRFLSLSHTPVSGMFTWIENWEKSAIVIHKKYQKLKEKSCTYQVNLSDFVQSHYDRQMKQENPIPIYMESSVYKDFIKIKLPELSDILPHTRNASFEKKLKSTLNHIDRSLFIKNLLIKFLLPNKPHKSSSQKPFIETIQTKLKELDFFLRLLTFDIWFIRRIKNHLILSLRQQQEGLEQKRKQILRNLRRIELFGYYDSRTVEPDLAQKYIYVTLQYQPEATTMPLAGAFANQLLTIQLLAYCVPSDVLIYVKEHPNQDVHCRSIKYYQEMASIPNVRLIPRNYNTFELTTHALAVATATGTVGWEALFKGKPVLMFGHYIYQYAPGVLPISSMEDCQRAIHKIIYENFKPDLDELKLFLQAIDETCFLANLNPYYEGLVNISIEQTMDNLTESIARHLTMSTLDGTD